VTAKPEYCGRATVNRTEAVSVLNGSRAKPRRLRSARMALPDSRLDELCRVASTTGNDPALDALLLRLHMETACRRGGALALAPDDLDPEQCLIRLREKGETVRWQPVSPTLMSHLLAHGETRVLQSPFHAECLRIGCFVIASTCLM